MAGAVPSPRRNRRVGLPRRDVALRMFTVSDPVKQEIVELVMRRGGRASSPCIPLCNAMKKSKKKLRQLRSANLLCSSSFACVRSSVHALAAVTALSRRRSTVVPGTGRHGWVPTYIYRWVLDEEV